MFNEEKSSDNDIYNDEGLDDEESSQCSSFMKFLIGLIWIVYLIMGCVFLFEGDYNKLSSSKDCGAMWGVYLARILFEFMHLLLWLISYMQVCGNNENGILDYLLGFSSNTEHGNAAENTQMNTCDKISRLLFCLVLAIVQTAVYAAAFQDGGDKEGGCRAIMQHNSFTKEAYLETWVWIMTVIDWIGFARFLLELIIMSTRM